MEEIVKLLFGVAFLVVGCFVGDYLARITEEELNCGENWFKLIIFICMVGGVVGLIMKNDAVLFTFAFMIIITLRSLNYKKSIKL